MSTSDIIQIIGIVTTSLTSIIAIIISIITLRQNSKMIEDSTRPYITIYFEAMQMGSPMAYFVVKNFGQSSATIINCSYNDAIKNNSQSVVNLKVFFDNLENMTLAPGQKYVIPCQMTEFNGDTAYFHILYGDCIHQYKEHITIPVANYAKYAKPRFVSSNENQNISYPLQEIAERLL